MAFGKSGQAGRNSSRRNMPKTGRQKANAAKRAAAANKGRVFPGGSTGARIRDSGSARGNAAPAAESHDK